MSLINQMLQELDARRQDVPGTSSFGEQVRAVRDSARKPYVLSAAVAGLILISVMAGVGSWLWLRAPSPSLVTAPRVPASPAASAAAPAPPQSLPLKIDAGLSAAPVAAPAPATISPEMPTSRGGVVNSPVPAQASSVTAKPVEPVPASEAKKEERARDRTVSLTATQPDKVAGVPRAVSPAKPVAARAGEEAQPSDLNKQFKDLTPQQRAENEYRKGLGSLQQGKVSEAVSSLEQTLQLNPMHAAARQSLVGILLERNYKDAALRRAREGLVFDVAQPGIAMVVARLQVEKGELDPAIETLERTLPYATDNADYQAFLAALLQRAERHKEAVEHYFLALRKLPQNGVWWMGVAISLQADRRKPEAIEAFKRAKAANSLTPALLEFVDTQLALLQQR